MRAPHGVHAELLSEFGEFDHALGVTRAGGKHAPLLGSRQRRNVRSRSPNDVLMDGLPPVAAASEGPSDRSEQEQQRTHDDQDDADGPQYSHVEDQAENQQHDAQDDHGSLQSIAGWCSIP